ncbi:hypothetical protein C464_11985 [Halorubrum coriense DSM 10284]|uniref:Uncharacterized protein n=1 Tax=Halorubrum coriense DSM 10284 TaxID=1227466 RepID=M0EFH0_9EURY|nr:hypothetical protein C464_11985 [Halorubrum coriense DSM 10284]
MVQFSVTGVDEDGKIARSHLLKVIFVLFFGSPDRHGIAVEKFTKVIGRTCSEILVAVVFDACLEFSTSWCAEIV